MSTLAISVKALASVRETLVASLYWRENMSETPLCLFESFMGNSSSVFTTSLSTVRRKTEDFIRLAFLFNAEEYHKGKFAKLNADPIEYGDFLRAVRNCCASRLGVFQLLKTLQMIEYNTNARCFMDEETYKEWSYREEYEKFHQTIARMISMLAQDIVERLPQAKEAKWCL